MNELKDKKQKNHYLITGVYVTKEKQDDIN